MTKIYQGSDQYRIHLDSGQILNLSSADIAELSEGLVEKVDELQEEVELLETVLKKIVGASSDIVDDVNGFLDCIRTDINAPEYSEMEDTQDKLKEFMDLVEEAESEATS